MPQSSVDQELLSNTNAAAMLQDRHTELIDYFDYAMMPEINEPAVDDFVAALFKILGYAHRDRVARTQAEIPFLICGKNKHATTDVCIFYCSRKEFLLLVQKERRVETNIGLDSAQAQLVATAVAAFNENNLQRTTIGLRPMKEKVSHS